MFYRANSPATQDTRKSSSDIRLVRVINKLETEIFRKIQQNDMKWRNKEEEPGVDGERLKVTWYFFVSLLDDACFDNSTNVYKVR